MEQQMHDVDWWYVAFVMEETSSRLNEFQGACVVQGEDEKGARATARRLGLHPTGTRSRAMVIPIAMVPSEDMRERSLSAKEIDDMWPGLVEYLLMRDALRAERQTPEEVETEPDLGDDAPDEPMVDTAGQGSKDSPEWSASHGPSPVPLFSPEVAFHGDVVRPGNLNVRSFSFNSAVRLKSLRVSKGFKVVFVCLDLVHEALIWCDIKDHDLDKEVEAKLGRKLHDRSHGQGMVENLGWKRVRISPGEGHSVVVVLKNVSDEELRANGVWSLVEAPLTDEGLGEEL